MNLLEKLLKENHLKTDNSSFRTDESGLHYSFEQGLEVSMLYNNKPDGRFQISQFEAFLVETKDTRESSSFMLSLSKQRKVGYIFPTSALSSYEYLPDDEWAITYASFALQFLVHDVNFIQHAKLPTLHEPYEFSISSFYAEKFAVVILGKESLTKYAIDTNQVKLMLMEYGYYSCERISIPNLYCELNYNPEFVGRLIIGETSPDIDHELSSKLEWLLSTSLREDNPFSCFMTLYQVIESLSIKVFNACIEVIKDNDVIDNPWNLKEKLSKVTNEKQRLNLLFHDFLKSGIEPDILDPLRSKCTTFLSNHNLIKTELKTAIEAFYKVRNTIVHRQIELNPKAYSELRDINVLLYDLCFHLIKNFDMQKGQEGYKKRLVTEETQDVEN
ncbi:hypothetical protein FOC93_00840 (plasmid) [Bacillus cereus]|uniref:hypothetical protein n=1 Tax=Bacillus cereus TaxID=1396 RepID=UPI000BFC1DE5|nr:hypothetical protein [Bacillus cereus]PGP95815.1 hypothetical protein COA10_25060 [Bacillus cereus]QKH04778.1 hypothetical protein FOC93_00840 [Bacillus cereus]QKH10540.1 hypothetical protein FOC92_00470 [Bacillus cereus]